MSIDITDPKTVETIRRWCRGNEDATRLILQMAQLARDVDDMIDEDNDKSVCLSTILELSLVHVGGNPFFQRFHGQLSAVVFEMIVGWRLGDRWRHDKDYKRQQFGYVLRESTDRLPIVIASLLGGVEYALQVAEEVQDLAHSHSKETFEDWVEENSPDGNIQRAKAP